MTQRNRFIVVALEFESNPCIINVDKILYVRPKSNNGLQSNIHLDVNPADPILADEPVGSIETKMFKAKLL